MKWRKWIPLGTLAAILGAVVLLFAALTKNGIWSEAAYRTDLAEAAVAELEEDGEDVKGEDWEKPEVEVTPGGE